ncbi:hypothetical protein D3C71_1999290 [compost metagenome]
MTVGRQHNRQTRNGPGHGKVLHGMMGHSECAITDAAADSDQFDVSPGIGYVYFDLFNAPHTQKAGG